MIEKNDDDAKTIMTGLIMTCVPSFPGLGSSLLRMFIMNAISTTTQDTN